MQERCLDSIEPIPNTTLMNPESLNRWPKSDWHWNHWTRRSKSNLDPPQSLHKNRRRQSLLKKELKKTSMILKRRRTLMFSSSRRPINITSWFFLAWRVPCLLYLPLVLQWSVCFLHLHVWWVTDVLLSLPLISRPQICFKSWDKHLKKKKSYVLI